jgi:uncharacterized coiled-coil DUF342 family protein
MKAIRLILVLMVAAALLAACASGVSDETKKQQGVAKNTARLKNEISEARKGIETWAQNVQKALAEYNSIVEGRATNSRETYGDLVNRVAELEKSAGRSRDSYKSMYDRAQTYYSGWQSELETYTNPDLKSASEAQYHSSKASFDAAHESLVAITGDYDAFLSNLREQTQFLGRDLGPEAVATLQPQKDQLNEQGRSLVERAGQVSQDLKEREKAIAP